MPGLDIHFKDAMHPKGTKCLQSGVEFPVAVPRRGPTVSLCTEPELRFIECFELSFAENPRHFGCTDRPCYVPRGGVYC